MDAAIPQPETIRQREVGIREHRRAQPMLPATRPDRGRRVRRNGQDFDAARIELGPKLLPSPQLGDTVGSPVSAKELDQDGRAQIVGERDRPAGVVDRSDIGEIAGAW